MRYIRTYLLSIFLLIAGITQAQNFSYSVATDTAGTYTELSSPTVLMSGQSFPGGYSFHIGLPFTFNFCGINTDSAFVDYFGVVRLIKYEKYSVIAFSNSTSRKDSLNQWVASISYQVTGTSGNRIVKIQYKNLAKYTFGWEDHLNYQVWLYENGNKVEIHMGPTLVPPDLVLIGLLNQNNDTDDKAYLLSGDPLAPSAQLISGEDFQYVYLDFEPREGIIYTFTPTY